jgi:hypothetical protein
MSALLSSDSIAEGDRFAPFRNKLILHGEELLASPEKLEDHPLWDVRYCLVVFTTTLDT